MIPSRRVALATSAVVVGLFLTSCGDAPARTSAGLPTISLGAAGRAGGEMAASADSKLSLAYWGDVTYEFAGDLPDLGTAATAYRFAAGVAPAADAVAALAAAFGVAGDVVQQPDEQGGGWIVGPSDYSGPTLNVARDGLLSWWYSSPTAGIAYPACGEVTSTGGGTNVAADGSSTAVAPPGTEVRTPDLGTTTPCPAPVPPSGVPTADEAKASAIELLSAAGVDTEGLDWDVYADDWSASATGYAMVDGSRSPRAWSVG